MPISTASLIVASSKDAVPQQLNAAIVDICSAALKARGVFAIALSGGSLPSFLSSIKNAFDARGVDPMFEKWHILLADERCVPSTNPDSNLGALQKSFLTKVPVPTSQIYGIAQDKLQDSAHAVATDYEIKVRKVLTAAGGQLDVAVLGFGPDGHTCSLFPGHELLKEHTKWVASIEDSPKPPPKRITLTFPVLNQHTRHVIFCGAGASKSPILQQVFSRVQRQATEHKVPNGISFDATMTVPPPYPCAMVLPDSEGTTNTLTWVVDADAMKGVPTL